MILFIYTLVLQKEFLNFKNTDTAPTIDYQNNAYDKIAKKSNFQKGF